MCVCVHANGREREYAHMQMEGRVCVCVCAHMQMEERERLQNTKGAKSVRDPCIQSKEKAFQCNQEGNPDKRSIPQCAASLMEYTAALQPGMKHPDTVTNGGV